MRERLPAAIGHQSTSDETRFDVTLQPIPTYVPLISSESTPLFDELAAEKGMYLAADEVLDISDAEFDLASNEAVALTQDLIVLTKPTLVLDLEIKDRRDHRLPTGGHIFDGLISIGEDMTPDLKTEPTLEPLTPSRWSLLLTGICLAMLPGMPIAALTLWTVRS